MENKFKLIKNNRLIAHKKPYPTMKISQQHFWPPLMANKQTVLKNFVLSNYWKYKIDFWQRISSKQRLKRELIKLKTIPYIKKRFVKNDKFITTEFYNFWFSQIRKSWWLRRSKLWQRKIMLSATRWRLFQFALRFRKARYWRNFVGFNWTKALFDKNQVINHANKRNFLWKRILNLNNHIKKYLCILNNSAFANKVNFLKSQRRLLLLNRKKRFARYLTLKLILKSISREKRMNLYYNLYSKFDSSTKSLSTLFCKKLDLSRRNLIKWQLKNKLTWPILHNKFPNYTLFSKLKWFRGQLKKMLKFNYNRYNIIYRLFFKRRVKLIYKPAWVNWKLTKKFRNLRRWKKEKNLLDASLTKIKINHLLVYNSRHHLRLAPAYRKGYSLIISITSSNFFINVVRSKSGNPIKIFSGGTMKVKTRRARRSFSTFIKTFILVIKFLKFRNIHRLKFIKFIQESSNPRLRINLKNMRFILKLFKDNNLKRIKRWIFQNKYVHGLPIRGCKLRRK